MPAPCGLASWWRGSLRAADFLRDDAGNRCPSEQGRGSMTSCDPAPESQCHFHTRFKGRAHGAHVRVLSKKLISGCHLQLLSNVGQTGSLGTDVMFMSLPFLRPPGLCHLSVKTRGLPAQHLMKLGLGSEGRWVHGGPPRARPQPLAYSVGGRGRLCGAVLVGGLTHSSCDLPPGQCSPSPDEAAKTRPGGLIPTTAGPWAPSCKSEARPRSRGK